MKKPNKYSAKAASIGGLRFDSKKEARRWMELQMLQKGGEIQHLERQVPIHLQGQHDAIRTPTGRKARYVADFYYFDMRKQKWVVEDVKGFRTKEYLLKKAILKAMGVNIDEV